VVSAKAAVGHPAKNGDTMKCVMIATAVLFAAEAASAQNLGEIPANGALDARCPRTCRRTRSGLIKSTIQGRRSDRGQVVSRQSVITHCDKAEVL
jgi:hypothetical protein